MKAATSSSSSAQSPPEEPDSAKAHEEAQVLRVMSEKEVPHSAKFEDLHSARVAFKEAEMDEKERGKTRFLPFHTLKVHQRVVPKGGFDVTVASR